MLSDRDQDFVRLFKWALATFNARLQRPVPEKDVTPTLMTSLLTVEGVRDKLFITESTTGVPRNVDRTLRDYRKLGQYDRQRKATSLFPHWSK